MIDEFVGFYDSKTEIFTAEGFKFFSEIMAEDLIGTIVDNGLAFMKPLRIIKKSNVSEVYKIKSNIIDIVATRDIRFYTSDEKNVDEFKFRLFTDLDPALKYYLPKTLSYEEDVAKDDKILDRISAAKLMAFIFVYGYRVEDYVIYLDSSRKEEYIEELKAVCVYQQVVIDETGEGVKISSEEHLIGIAPVVEMLDDGESSFSFIVPTWLSMLDPQAKRAFIESVVHYSESGKSLNTLNAGRNAIDKITLDNFQVMAFQGSLPVKISSDPAIEFTLEDSSYILRSGNKIDVKEESVSGEFFFNVAAKPTNVLLLRRSGHLFLGSGAFTKDEETRL